MTDVALAPLDRLELHDDRVLLGDVVFALEDLADGVLSAELPGAFSLHKSKALLEDYVDLLRAHDPFSPLNVFELGIWNGGSTVLWFELFEPRRLVAVDIGTRGDDDDFRRFVRERGAEARVRTYWSTDQADRRRLREIVASDFDGALDLVIDDASHLYEPTKASFEALFPALRPGGLYIVEDWPWSQLAQYRDPSHPWSRETPLTQLLLELVRAVAGAPEVVRRVHAYYAFFVVERGPAEVNPESFSLAELAERLR
jgi:predicted O-methyltransferase YrrM